MSRAPDPGPPALSPRAASLAAAWAALVMGLYVVVRLLARGS